jgi:6-pyruvoyltetrahydropterin/6-carboxytetrahydropterin synthase
MYEVTIKKAFSAAHCLQDVEGPCEALHGHNFLVEVTIRGRDLDKSDLLIDFRLLKKWTEEVLKDFDHKHLNELESFQNINPSSEQLARLIFLRLEEKLRIPRARLVMVTIWESDNARVSYCHD